MPRLGRSQEIQGSAGSPVTAILGPTNTGKTHRAIERMLEHPTGMIGLPLRLLAREVYDRVTARVGERAVALVTGEEKRVPAHPRYWICTVEAMLDPRQLPGGGVDFVAVDEIQLAAHPERGHVFTDRLQHARGDRETYLMGADTMRPILDKLVPGVQIESRPRLSTLTSAGRLSLGALPPRSAVVTFSATRVYDLGARLRARRGGAAIVLGALSPRVRNAQVAMYQAGEVDYLVATDAIGMGLNMDVGCVAFADLEKFDGQKRRDLRDSELAQIAGRAGRHANDGQFATLDPLPALSPATVRAIERHRFAPETRVYWRAHDLDTTNLETLRADLGRRPSAPHLSAADRAEDARALQYLSRQPEILARLTAGASVSLLWQVCQVPDFRSFKLDDHFLLVESLFLQLSDQEKRSSRLSDDWIASHVDRLDNIEGDLETLLARMAGIRTWTYVSNQSRWVNDAAAWQSRAREIEDRLSDALHDKLVATFVDPHARRRTPKPRSAGPVAGRPPSPQSFAEQLLAHMRADLGGTSVDGALKAPGVAWSDHSSWVEDITGASHARFRLVRDERIAFDDEIVARLVAGVDLLHPEVLLVTQRELGAGARLRLSRRLLAWARDLVADLVTPLRSAQRASNATPGERGILYQLEQGLGTVPAHLAQAQLGTLDGAAIGRLRHLGIKRGRRVLFIPALLNPGAVQARVALCNAYFAAHAADARIVFPRPTMASLRVVDSVPRAAYEATGYPVFGDRAIRADLVDGVADRLSRGARAGDIAAQLGCTPFELDSLRAAFETGEYSGASRDQRGGIVA